MNMRDFDWAFQGKKDSSMHNSEIYLFFNFSIVMIILRTFSFLLSTSLMLSDADDSLTMGDFFCFFGLATSPSFSDDSGISRLISSSSPDDDGSVFFATQSHEQSEVMIFFMESPILQQKQGMVGNSVSKHSRQFDRFLLLGRKRHVGKFLSEYLPLFLILRVDQLQL